VSDDPAAARGAARTYAGAAIEVLWEPGLCIHAKRCVDALGDVFDPQSRPWIRLGGADPDRIAATVASCPSGALHFRRLDGGAQEEPDAETTIEPRPDGPLYVRGRVRILAEDGTLLREDSRVALCRCGRSQHKPFCDGTHRTNGFTTGRLDTQAER
jgi:uncharacterized Fe-S cluster protein YjdI/CDGSH-type Zn-finger protein